MYVTSPPCMSVHVLIISYLLTQLSQRLVHSDLCDQLDQSVQRIISSIRPDKCLTPVQFNQHVYDPAPPRHTVNYITNMHCSHGSYWKWCTSSLADPTAATTGNEDLFLCASGGNVPSSPIHCSLQLWHSLIFCPWVHELLKTRKHRLMWFRIHDAGFSLKKKHLSVCPCVCLSVRTG